MEISPACESQRNKLESNTEQRPDGCMKLENLALPLTLSSVPFPATTETPDTEL